MTNDIIEQNKIIDALYDWINNFVAKKHKEFGNLPACPYAQAALRDNTMRVEIVYDDLLNKLKEFGDDWTDEGVEILAVITPTERYSAEEFEKISDEINDYLMPMNLVALDDHPHNVETHEGLELNFGKAALFLVARLDVLNSASLALAKNTNYYKSWTKEHLNWVTLWRFESTPEEFKKYID